MQILQLLQFLLLCMKLLVSGVGAGAEVRCIERERQALLKFKESLTGGDLSELNWGSEDDNRECCNWYGVECSITGHVITSVDLSDLNLRGNISTALRELQQLEYLDLSRNELTADNLNWLSNLSSLSFLDLSGNNLRTVTNWVQPIMKLSSLEVLFFSGCQLRDTLSNFDVFMNSSSSSLSTVDLSHNNLTSFSTFDSLIEFGRKITLLVLSYNQLHGHVPGTFLKLRFLEELYLQGNVLDQGVDKPLRNLSHLHTLDISFNRLNVPLPHLFQNLSEILSLQSVDLSNNQLVGSLPDITRFSSLWKLRLSNNQLDEVHPQSLDQPSNLKYLSLSYNQLSGSLLDLRGFSSLQELDLSGNQLKKLPKFEQLFELRFLNLSSTSLEGTLITEHHLSILAQLTQLDLSFNNVSINLRFDWNPPFRMEGLHLNHCNMGPYFPNWIQKLNSLMELSLSFAGISDMLPHWLWNMSSIKHLDLSHNNISGKIPHFHSELNYYAFLDLSYNNLSGPIPSSIFQRCSETLILSRNMLSGSISNLCTIFENCTIQFLILPNNQLDGELPDCWTNLKYLIVLNLANNKLSGEIPPTLGTLGSLLILHLGNNSFTGELPSFMKNLQLIKLDVGGNKLTGTIPAWIGTHLTNLEVLSLRLNSFHGSIPPTICFLTNINILDLSRNNISGTIPRCLNNFTSLIQNDASPILQYNPFLAYFGHLLDDDNNALVQWKGQESEYKRFGNLKGIDLSSNKLFGTIPQEFSDLRGLVFINLSRNHLTGNIISRIGQLDTLEWLDLSRNQLFGKIPNGLANLHFLSVLDLSYNNLMGKIPLSTQLQSFDPSAYAGNSQLCGNPLSECPHDPSVTDHDKVRMVEEDDRLINRDFCICMAFGFITWFWVVVGTLVLKRSWRHSYFNF